MYLFEALSVHWFSSLFPQFSVKQINHTCNSSKYFKQNVQEVRILWDSTFPKQSWKLATLWSSSYRAIVLCLFCVLFTKKPTSLSNRPTSNLYQRLPWSRRTMTQTFPKQSIFSSPFFSRPNLTPGISSADRSEEGWALNTKHCRTWIQLQNQVCRDHVRTPWIGGLFPTALIFLILKKG